MIIGKWKQEEKGMQHPQKLVPSQRDPKREMKFPSLIAKTFHMQVKIFHSKLSPIAMFRKINILYYSKLCRGVYVTCINVNWKMRGIYSFYCPIYLYKFLTLLRRLD